jgi:hypothetical protein
LWGGGEEDFFHFPFVPTGSQCVPRGVFPIAPCFKFCSKSYTYDLRTTLVVRGAGGCLTTKKGPWCGAVLVRCGAVFVAFCYFFYCS